jgi:hypothetical protein
MCACTKGLKFRNVRRLAVSPDEVVKYMALSQTQFNLFQSIYGSIYTCIWPKAKLPWFWNEFLEESLKTLDEGRSK